MTIPVFVSSIPPPVRMSNEPRPRGLSLLLCGPPTAFTSRLLSQRPTFRIWRMPRSSPLATSGNTSSVASIKRPSSAHPLRYPPLRFRTTMRMLRSVLVLFSVLIISPLAAAPPGGPSSVFRLTGDVTKRTSFDLETLQVLPVTKEKSPILLAAPL